MGKRLDRMTDYLWQATIVASIPAIIGLAFAMKPTPLPDNDRPFWSDGDHLRNCPACRSGLSEFNAVPAATLEEQRDVVQDMESVPTSPWTSEVAFDTRPALEG